MSLFGQDLSMSHPKSLTPCLVFQQEADAFLACHLPVNIIISIGRVAARKRLEASSRQALPSTPCCLLRHLRSPYFLPNMTMIMSIILHLVILGTVNAVGSATEYARPRQQEGFEKVRWFGTTAWCLTILWLLRVISWLNHYVFASTSLLPIQYSLVTSSREVQKRQQVAFHFSRESLNTVVIIAVGRWLPLTWSWRLHTARKNMLSGIIMLLLLIVALKTTLLWSLSTAMSSTMSL